MKIHELLSLCLSLTAFTCFADKNMIRNPGFENGENKPAEWALYKEGAAPGSARWDTDNPHSGKYCVRLELDAAGDYWMAQQAYTNGSAKPNQFYRLKGWYRSTGGMCAPGVYFRDAENQFKGSRFGLLPPTDEWREFEVVFKTGSDTDHLELQLRMQSWKGVSWFDDLVLEEADGVEEEYNQLAAPLLAIAEKDPDSFWAIVSNNGSAEFRFASDLDLNLAWIVSNAKEDQSDYGIRIERFRGNNVCERQEIIAPANTELESALFSVSLEGITETRVTLFSDHVGAAPVLLAGFKATKEAAATLVNMKATPVSAHAARLFSSEPRILKGSQAELDEQKRNDPNALPRRALGLSGEKSDVVVIPGGWNNFTGKEWMDWLMEHPDVQAKAPAASGARNEYVSLQVLCANPGRTESLTAELSGLRGPDGAAIPSSGCQVRLVEYVPIGYQWLPDPLMEDQPFKPSGNGPLVLWVTVHIPKEASAGLYNGTLAMRFDGGEPVKQEVSIQVWDFELQDETHLQTSFWTFRSQIEKYFGLPAGSLSLEDYQPYLDLAMSHRLSPIDQSAAHELLLSVYREADGSLSYDFSKWDVYLNRLKAGGANTIPIGFSCHMARFFSDKYPVPVVDRQTGETGAIDPEFCSDEHLDALVHYLRAARAHLEERGELDKAYLQLFDEPGLTSGDMENSYRVMAGLKERAPEIERMVTRVNPEEFGGKIAEVANHWCPISTVVDGRFKSVRERGDRMWWYVCCNPRQPFANLFTDYKAPEMRVLFWQTWQKDITGLLYWGLNYWGVDFWSPVPPLDERFPNGPWTADANRAGAGAKGDGYFFYPGPAVDQPLSSIRLETIRDGMEDYELLYLLNELVEKNLDADPALLAKAREILEVRPSVSKNLREYDRTGEAMDAERQIIAELIMKLQGES